MLCNFVFIKSMIGTQLALQWFVPMHRMIMHVSVIVGIKSPVTVPTVIRSIIQMMRLHVNGQVSLSVSLKVTDSVV